VALTRSRRILYHALAVLGVVGALVVLYISARGPAEFPEHKRLVHASGAVLWAEPDAYSVNFRLAGDTRMFSYARKSGELPAVAAALQNPASQPVTVAVLKRPRGPTGQPFYEVYEFADALGTTRSLAQVREAWSTDYKFGYLAALLLFLAAAALEFVVRRSQPNNSSKPTPLRGAA
jgi:hypothetical protein